MDDPNLFIGLMLFGFAAFAWGCASAGIWYGGEIRRLNSEVIAVKATARYWLTALEELADPAEVERLLRYGREETQHG